MSKKLELGLFGVFSCRWTDGQDVQIRSAKQRALLAMLFFAPGGTHSRVYLQEHLWGRAGEELGRQSLRRSMADLRKVFGEGFDILFQTNNFEIKLKRENIIQVSSAQHGLFLEGVKIHEKHFQAWLEKGRNVPLLSASMLDSDTRLQVLPSIAVLPFLPVNGENTEAQFLDLLAMDLARALSRSRFLDVISHLSSRTFSGSMPGLDQLQKQLNADYIISGNGRVSGGKYRLNADFIQTSTGRILLTETFEGDVSEVLNGDSMLVMRIAQQCGKQILRAEVEIASSRPLPQVKAHALFMASITGMHQHHLATFAKSRQYLEELVNRLPGHSQLHAWLAKWYILSIAQGWSTDVHKDSLIAADCTARGLDINPDCPTTLTIDGMIQGDRQEDMSLAMSRFQSAIEVDPNQGLAWLMYSRMNSFLGNGPQALAFAQKAQRLSPIDPHGYFYDIMLAMAHLVDGNFEFATQLARQSLAKNPRHISSYRILVMAQQMAGHGDEARQTAEVLLKLEPNLTVESYLRTHPAGRLSVGRQWASALKDAGVPSF